MKLKLRKPAPAPEPVQAQHPDPAPIAQAAPDTEQQATATETTPEQPPALDIDKEIVATDALLSEARELRQQLLVELHKGMDRNEQIDSMELEIASHERKLKRLREAKALATAGNSKSARKKRAEAARQELQSAIDDARKAGKDAQEILAAVADIGGKLQALQDLRDGIYARIAAALQAVPGKSDTVRLSEAAQLRTHLAALSLPSHFWRACWDAGIGRRGVQLADEALQLRPLSGLSANGGTENPEAAVTAAVERLRSMANRSLVAIRESA